MDVMSFSNGLKRYNPLSRLIPTIHLVRPFIRWVEPNTLSIAFGPWSITLKTFKTTKDYLDVPHRSALDLLQTMKHEYVLSIA